MRLRIWGLTVKAEGGAQKIKSVSMGSPAQVAGIWAGDELVAIAGYKVTAASLSERLKSYHPDEAVTVTVFQQGKLKTVEVTLAEPQPENFTIVPLENATNVQKRRCTAWIGGYPSDNAE